MRTIAPRQAISTLAVMPILLIANTTEALASVNTQTTEPLQKVSDVSDEFNFDFAVPVLSSIEESEDWDEPEFSDDLDRPITELINVGSKAETDDRMPTIIDESLVIETEEQLPIVYISAARGQSTRECRISGICE
ncbi:MAG: hypothetical protein ACRC62_28825 [Microcoleus sp.]